MELLNDRIIVFNFKRNWNSFQECAYYLSPPHQPIMSLSGFLYSSTVSIITFSIPVGEALSLCGFSLHSSHDFRHIVMYILVICVSSFLKCLFKSFSYLQIQVVVFWVLMCKICLHIWDISSLSCIFLVCYPQDEKHILIYFILDFYSFKLHT